MNRLRLKPKAMVAWVIIWAVVMTATVVTFPAKRAQAGLSDGLVLHLGFEDNLDDSSGNGNNGAAIGNYTYVDGVYGRAIQFGEARRRAGGL